MKIEFENGSIIQTIDNAGKVIRGSNAKEYIFGIDLSNNENIIEFSRPLTGMKLHEAAIYDITKDGIEVRAIEVKKGLKITVRDSVLNELQNNAFIQENFKLNVIRLNRWWYSVYFDKKCNHDNIVTYWNINWCRDCGVKLND